MICRYTCTACGLVIRLDYRAEGREAASCMCDVEITEQVEPE